MTDFRSDVIRLAPSANDAIDQKSGGVEHLSPPLVPYYWEGERPNIKTSWLVRDLFPSQTVGLIVGESQAGKSFLAIDLAVCVAQGKPFFGKTTSKGGVLYIAAEGGFTIPERLKAARKGISREEKLAFICIDRPPDLTTVEGVDAIIATARDADQKMRAKFGIPLSLVIVDTLMSGFSVKSWNEVGETSNIIKTLSRIGAETGATVIAVHHHGKEPGRGAAGSFALTAAPDAILSVFRKVAEDGTVSSRHIALTKSRCGETGWTCNFDLESVQTDLLPDGEEVWSAVVKPQLETAGLRRAKLKTSKPSKPDPFRLALEEALRLKGIKQSAPDGNGSVTAVAVSTVRDTFSRYYHPKADCADRDEAIRAAFKRARKSADGILKVGRWDGEDWLYLAANE